MSTPISAMMHSAARLPTPVMVSSRSRASAKGAITRSTRSSSSAMAASRWAVWSKHSRISSAWWSRNRPRSASRSSGIFLRSTALGQLGQHLGVAFTGDERGQHRPARHAQHVGGDRVQLDAGVLEGLLDPLALAGVGLDEPFAVAGQVAQLADRRRRHEAAAQQPVLEQLGQPLGVSHVGLAARAGS